MLQSQLKPSHCCRHTPWLAHESSWQVVLGPGDGETGSVTTGAVFAHVDNRRGPTEACAALNTPLMFGLLLTADGRGRAGPHSARGPEPGC